MEERLENAQIRRERDEARAEVVRIGKELEAERRLTAAYAEQARTHRCNPPELVDLLIQEGTG